MSKELARLPFVNKECLQAISQYEAQYGEVIVGGKRYYDELKGEELLSPRKVGLIFFIHCRLLHLSTRGYTSGGDGYVHCYTILFFFSLFLLLLNLFVWVLIGRTNHTWNNKEEGYKCRRVPKKELRAYSLFFRGFLSCVCHIQFVMPFKRR